jgi:predicted phosphodiesterase
MMFAAIADIHGNRPALEAVLADIAALNIADVVNLGDHITGPLEAARTSDLLMERGFPSIRGDQDRILLELRATGTSRRGEFRELERKHFEWLAAMPATLRFRDEVFLCHGAPNDDSAFWLDAPTADGSVRESSIEAIERQAQGIDASLVLCAHTHIPRIVRLGDGRMVVNPGSVGLPGYTGTRPIPYKVETGTPDACYAILRKTPHGWSAAFRYVPYDSSAMALLARQKGLPDWASAIETGWIR